MKFEKKISILGSNKDQLPVTVQMSRLTSRQKINEDYDLSSTMSPRGEGGHTQMYLMFVQPFVDVLKSFKFAAMQFSNSLKLLWKIFTVFDPGEFEDEVDLYNERRQQINKQWQPLLDKAEQVMGRTDPLMKMSLLGPQVFLADKTFRAGLAAGKPIAEILTATGWDQLVNNFKTDFDPNENLNKNSARIQKNQKKILNKLNRIFFTSSSKSTTYYESRENDDEIITEAEASSDPQKKMSPEESVKKFLEVSGLQAKFDDTKILNSNNILRTAPKLEKLMLPLNFSSDILASKNFEEFAAAVEKIKAAGGNIKVNLPEIKKELQNGAADLAKQENFRATFESPADKMKIEAVGDQKIDENEILEKAEAYVFTNSKESLNVQVMDQLRVAIPAIEKGLNQIKQDPETVKAMEKDEFEVVKRAAEVYNDLMSSYKKIVENSRIAGAK